MDTNIKYSKKLSLFIVVMKPIKKYFVESSYYIFSSQGYLESQSFAQAILHFLHGIKGIRTRGQLTQNRLLTIELNSIPLNPLSDSLATLS